MGRKTFTPSMAIHHLPVVLNGLWGENAFTKPSILGEVETRIYIGSVLFFLYNVYLFILLFILPLINAFTKPSILEEVETRIYISVTKY